MQIIYTKKQHFLRVSRLQLYSWSLLALHADVVTEYIPSVTSGFLEQKKSVELWWFLYCGLNKLLKKKKKDLEQ